MPVDHSDRRIIAALKQRNPEAMRELYDRHGGCLYAVVRRIVGSSEEAEEIVQEVFLRAWSRAHLLGDSVETLKPWLLTVGRNLALDHLRKQRCRRFAFTTYETIAAPCEEEYFLSSHEPALRLAFAELPADQKSVITFAYFEGLSQSEISERMGKPLGTVKTWARTALMTLRKSFVPGGNYT